MLTDDGSLPKYVFSSGESSAHPEPAPGTVSAQHLLPFRCPVVRRGGPIAIERLHQCRGARSPCDAPRRPLSHEPALEELQAHSDAGRRGLLRTRLRLAERRIKLRRRSDTRQLDEPRESSSQKTEMRPVLPRRAVKQSSAPFSFLYAKFEGRQRFLGGSWREGGGGRGHYKVST